MGTKKKSFVKKILAGAGALALAALLGFWISRDRDGQAEPKSLSVSEPEAEASPSPAEEQPPGDAAEKEPVPTLRQTPEPTPGLAETLETVPAGTIVAEAEIDRSNLGLYFQAYEISDRIFERIYGDDRSYKTYCTVPREDLRYVKVLHYDYDGQIRVGELLVNALLAEDMKEIFQILFEHQYQIEKMFLIDDYGADDNRSVNDNNTSCFNFRLVTNGGTLSNHAAGCAIDINPRQNPYYVILEDGTYTWENEDAQLYMDRDAPDAAERHMITHADLCYQVFSQYGYSWGGDWGNPLDYQHFEKVVYEAEMPDAAVAE